ncbi:hypothetical protein EDD16DRAFT_69060 [Pisolithus croceorrhizus]|nr:hypothetical protein EDD16DRAFT_69060 [Pisolithus croceorrhizus]KAI6149088.1 hypothetical protein EDD17DRAFT_1642820 [Pisolithus thermaeus]
MKELSNARAELARLQCVELELLQDLLDVRKALAAQKVVIDELIKASAVPPINRLPNELLAQIFLLISDERESLATVSRRWRVVIMETPTIWSEICLSHYYSRPDLLKLHLDRSRQAPLTISLHYNQTELEVVLPHVNRIHTLRIFGSASDVFDEFASLAFPSLENLLVDLESNSIDRLLSIYSRSPALKCLELAGLDGPPLVSGLTAGLLGNSPPHCPSRIFPAESLTMLSLLGFTDSWNFLPDSIHFPILESLTFQINDPMSFLEAIVAPKLERFRFSVGHGVNFSCRAFNGPASKFDSVFHLSFTPSPTRRFNQDASELVKEFCQVFRGVRYANIHITYLLPPSHWMLVYRDDHYIPIDNWTCLESLEIRDFSFIRAEYRKYLVEWFTKRRNSGQRRLHLKLVSDDFASDYLSIRETSNAYRVLQQCCASVELHRIPASSVMDLSTLTGSLLLSPPVFELGSDNRTDLAAPVQTRPVKTVEGLLAQLWTL